VLKYHPPPEDWTQEPQEKSKSRTRSRWSWRKIVSLTTIVLLVAILFPLGFARQLSWPFGVTLGLGISFVLIIGLLIARELKRFSKKREIAMTPRCKLCGSLVRSSVDIEPIGTANERAVRCPECGEFARRAEL